MPLANHLNGELFYSLGKAQFLIGQRMKHENINRPHPALDNNLRRKPSFRLIKGQSCTGNQTGALRQIHYVKLSI